MVKAVSLGAIMAKRYHEGMYEGSEGRRHQELRDGGIIREDHSAVANLPQDVKYQPWEKSSSYITSDLNDDISGVDRQKREDVDGLRRHLGVHKW